MIHQCEYCCRLRRKFAYETFAPQAHSSAVSGPEKIPKQRLNRAFSRKYIAKLVDKVHRQAPEPHRTGLDARLNVSREKFRYGSDRLVEVLQNGTKDDARSAI